MNTKRGENLENLGFKCMVFADKKFDEEGYCSERASKLIFHTEIISQA